MKWFLIIIVITNGGLFGSDEVAQQKLGPYSSKKAAKRLKL